MKTLVSDEYTTLIYKMGQKTKTETIIRDLQAVVRRITNMLKNAHGLKLHRIQNILR